MADALPPRNRSHTHGSSLARATELAVSFSLGDGDLTPDVHKNGTKVVGHRGPFDRGTQPHWIEEHLAEVERIEGRIKRTLTGAACMALALAVAQWMNAYGFDLIRGVLS